MSDAINWFEIAVTDINRASRFYSAILGRELAPMEVTPGFPMAMFPYEKGVGGALVAGEGYAPSDKGAIIYLNGDPDLSLVLDRVEAAGGQVLEPKTSIGEHGFVAYFRDTEGNRVGLHSNG